MRSYSYSCMKIGRYGWKEEDASVSNRIACERCEKMLLPSEWKKETRTKAPATTMTTRMSRSAQLSQCPCTPPSSQPIDWKSPWFTIKSLATPMAFSTRRRSTIRRLSNHIEVLANAHMNILPPSLPFHPRIFRFQERFHYCSIYNSSRMCDAILSFRSFRAHSSRLTHRRIILQWTWTYMIENSCTGNCIAIVASSV